MMFSRCNPIIHTHHPKIYSSALIKSSSRLTCHSSNNHGQEDEEERNGPKESKLAPLLNDGPDLADFIAGVIPRGSSFSDFQGIQLFHYCVF